MGGSSLSRRLGGGEGFPPEAVEVVMNRLTVRAVTEYIVGQLAAAGRLAPGA